MASVGDVFRPGRRGLALNVFGIGPMCGPALGSTIASYFVLTPPQWRLSLYFLGGVAGLVFVLIFFAYEETYPLVNRRRAEEALNPPTLSKSGKASKWLQALERQDEIRAVFGRALSRPPRLALNPVIGTHALSAAHICRC